MSRKSDLAEQVIVPNLPWIIGGGMLISGENAQLRAELGAVKDRLATVERIVTDDSHRLTQEIESLRVTRN